MKNNEASVFIFIASVFLGVLISSNMSFANKSKKVVYLSSKQYEDAYRKKSALLNEINDINKQYVDLKNNIKDYDKASEDFNSTKNQMQNELILNKIQLGTVDVIGQGVDITLDDSGNQISASSEDANFREVRTIYQVIHDFDMRGVINDLKCAGAEAISINGQRIVANTEIYCNAEFLLINGVKISTPFNIKAIGNIDKLKTYMLSSENHMQNLKRRSIYVKLKTSKDIKIPAFKGELRHSKIK